MKTSGMGGSRLEKIDTLTSLRFFAAALIVVGHGFPYFQTPSFAQQIPLNQGVSFFFVLSGFILAYVYPKLPTLKDVLHFLWARFSRIWPAHIAALLLMLCVVPSALWYVSASHPIGYTIANVLMVHSWIPFRESYLGLNGVSWSISTELFFYLCFPFLIYQWQKTWPIKIILVTFLLLSIIVISNILQLPSSSSYPGIGTFALVYVNPLSRLFEFTLGIISYRLFYAMKQQANKLSFGEASLIEVFIVSLVIITMWMTKHLASNDDLTLLIGQAGIVWLESSGTSIMFSILIVTFAFQRGILSVILKHPILVLLGEISFSLYLVHTIVLKYFDSHGLLTKDYGYFFYWVFSILFAYLIFRTTEIPLRKFLLNLPRLRRGINNKINISIVKTKTFLLFCILMGLTVFAAQFKFSTLNIINKKQLNKIIKSGNILKSKVNFSNGLSLVYLSSIEKDNAIKFKFIWCASNKITLNQHVGFHFLDSQKKIIAQSDFLLDKNYPAIEASTCFVVSPKSQITKLLNFNTLGVALYVNPKELIKIKSESVDWNSHRLLIPVKNGIIK